LIRVQLSDYCKGRPKGGPRIFVSRLMQYLSERGSIKTVDRRPDIYFSTVFAGKRPKGCHFVYRAAACYYDRNQLRRHGINQKIKRAIEKADSVVFQTGFARRLCFKVLGVSKAHKSKSTIIFNGFENKQFVDIEPARIPAKNTFVANAAWDRYKRLVLLMKAFVKAKIPDSALIIIGKPDVSIKGSNIISLGRCKLDSIVAVLKNQPYFVHMSYVDICPNAVVEALSYGCPVLCNNIGGTPELVGKDGIVAKCDAPFRFKRHCVNIGAKNMSPIVAGYQQIIHREWKINRDDLSMAHCASEYLRVFRKTMAN